MNDPKIFIPKQRVWVVLNTGSAGISQYQYIGVFTDHYDNNPKHVFLSPCFVSTVCLLVGREDNCVYSGRILMNEAQAREKQRLMREKELSEYL